MLNGLNNKVAAFAILTVSCIGNAAYASSTPIVLEGDILTLPESQQRSAAHGHKDRVWPNGVIPYVLSDDLSAKQMNNVLEATQHWNDMTEMSLVALSDVPVEQQNDYVVFKPSQGCASWVGRQGGAQDIWVGANCTVGSLIHEIGHAVGFVHEHTRPDRDQYINIAWENISEEKQHNFDVPDFSVKTRGEYDFDSIMHYGETFFSKNGQPTIEVIGGEHKNIGQRVALSAGDIAAVTAMYSDTASESDAQSLDDYYAANGAGSFGWMTLLIFMPLLVRRKLSL